MRHLVKRPDQKADFDGRGYWGPLRCPNGPFGYLEGKDEVLDYFGLVVVFSA